MTLSKIVDGAIILAKQSELYHQGIFNPVASCFAPVLVSTIFQWSSAKFCVRNTDGCTWVILLNFPTLSAFEIILLTDDEAKFFSRNLICPYGACVNSFHAKFFRISPRKSGLVSFSKTLNTTRPLDSWILMVFVSLKNSLVHVFQIALVSRICLHLVVLDRSQR